jgi:hypothetical protein
MNPAAAVFVLRALKSNVFFDYLEAVTRQREGNCALRYGKQVEKVPEPPSGRTTKSPCLSDVLVDVGLFLVVPMDKWNVPIYGKKLLRCFEKCRPSFLIAVHSKSSRPMNELER